MTSSPVGSTLDRRVLSVLAVLVALFAVYFYRRPTPTCGATSVYGQLFLENGGRIVADPYAYTSDGPALVYP